jgi:MFS family permease
VIGSLFGVIGFSAYSMSHTLWGFVLAEIMLGIGESFISGADSALLYDTLVQEKKEHKYLKFEGNLSALGSACEALAGLFVSLFVFQFLRTDFIIQTFLAVVAFIACLFLTEPSIHTQRQKPGFGDIWKTVSETFRENKVLGRLVILSSFAGYASLTMAWFAQKILLEIGIDKSYFGYSWVILNFTVALGSLLSLRVNRILGRNLSIIVLGLVLSMGFIAVGFRLSFFAIAPLLVFYFFRGAAHPILKNYINNLAPSDKRATILSLRSLVIRILYSGFGPIFGYITDTINLKVALMLCGVSVFIPTTVFTLLLLSGKNTRFGN